jgi:hypothetical protein
LRTLGGELLRRIGKFDDANLAFQAMRNDVSPASAEGRIVEFEISLCEKQDNMPHLAVEAMGPDDADYKRSKGLIEAIKTLQ